MIEYYLAREMKLVADIHGSFEITHMVYMDSFEFKNLR